MQYVFVFESFLDTNELSYEIYTYAVTKVRFDFLLESFLTLSYVNSEHSELSLE